MGLEKAKSLLEVKDGKTFLDLIAEQIKYTRSKFGSNVRFILMNSFSTSADTKEYLNKTHPDLMNEPDVELIQNKSPKVDAETLGPVSNPEDTDLEWYAVAVLNDFAMLSHDRCRVRYARKCRCPPGHGDIYPSLLGSGMLDRLIEAGIKYVFVSNSDNLGATLDLQLLAYFAETDKAFVMEVMSLTVVCCTSGI